MDEADPAVNAPASSAAQVDIDREVYKSVGYRKLNELQLLKAAASRLLLQAESQAVFSPRSTSSSSSPSSSLPPLSRANSSVDSCLMQPSRLARSCSISTDRVSLPHPQRLCRSNSAGSHRLTASLPTVTQALLQQQHPLQRPVSPLTGAGPVLWGADATFPRHPARHSAPGGAVHDPLVDMLLLEVESLLAERRQLTTRCSTLERENSQLAELVGRLSLSLDEQQQLRQQAQQQVQLGSSNPAAVSGSKTCDAAATHPELLTDVSLQLPSVQQQQQQRQQQQQQLQQRQRRVSEWLDRRQEWQEWQERLPLEHMHSGSSSSLTVALEQQ